MLIILSLCTNSISEIDNTSDNIVTTTPASFFSTLNMEDEAMPSFTNTIHTMYDNSTNQAQKSMLILQTLHN